MVAVGGHFAVSSRVGGGVRRPAVDPRLHQGNNPAGPAGASREDTAFSRNRRIGRSNLRLCEQRMRIRRFFPSSSQNAVTSASAGRLELSPGGEVQCPPLLDRVEDRLAPCLCATPPPSEFQLLPASRRRPVQLLRLDIGCRARHGVTRPTTCPWGQHQKASTAQSITAQPFHPKGYHECQKFLPTQQNSANENYHEYESKLHHA